MTYDSLKFDTVNLEKIPNSNIITIDSEWLFDPATEAPRGSRLKFDSMAPRPGSVISYGPYLHLEPGFYVARLDGTLSGVFDVRFTAGFGAELLGSQTVRSTDDVLVFQAITGADNCEIVITETKDSRALDLGRIDLFRMSAGELSAAGVLPPQIHQLQYLQQEPWATNPGVANRRNIQAGYLRGQIINGGGHAVQSDPDWIKAQEASCGLSIVALANALNIYMILKHSKIDGNIIEFGAYRGGNALFMAALLKRFGSNRKVYALDTFEGMPDICDPLIDRHRAGGFSEASYESLITTRDRLGLDNLIILKGLFHDVVGQIPVEERKFFLSHIDCDIYESVKYAIEYSINHATSGGYLVFDDPLVHDCIGAFQAVEEELVQKRGLHAEQAYPNLVYRYAPGV